MLKKGSVILQIQLAGCQKHVFTEKGESVTQEDVHLEQVGIKETSSCYLNKATNSLMRAELQHFTS